MTVLEALKLLLARPKGTGEGATHRMPDERVWACGDCGFAFVADQTDEGTDGHSCPACFEETVRAALPALVATAEFALRHLDHEGAAEALAPLLEEV